MLFDFKFWRYLTNPHDLATTIQTSSMRGFNQRLIVVFLMGVLLFSLRDVWGMSTESITPLLATMTTADYTIARFTSLVGAILWSLLYMSFHIYGLSYILSQLTAIPFKRLVPLQLIVTGLLLLEKALVFFFFVLKGETTNVSFLSFGPLATTFLENGYMIFFLNQLTLTTALIIGFQFKFIRAYTELNERKGLVWLLIGLHIVMALLTAAIGFIPIEKLLNLLVIGGGVHV